MNARALSWFALPLLLACGGSGDPIPDPGPHCGDGVVDPGEACDDGPANSDVAPGACRRDCSAARCGDGVRDEGEACDEGSANDDARPDACRTTCELPFCGDGVTDEGEACDAGAANGNDDGSPCRTDCTLPHCGDGALDSLEGCDDGLANSDTLPDACRSDCRPARCGDGVADTGEACDDGDGNDDRRPDACRTDCREARCGDGVVDAGEGCDDGEANSDTVADACRTNCMPASCGDGVVDAGEACDEGIENSDTLPGACRTSCVPASCGDGVVDAGEACDDGAANSDLAPDACRTGCVLPTCGDGVRDTGEGCDHGAGNADDVGGACRTGCTVPFCGDGVVDPGEGCDPGTGFDDVTPNACRSGCREAFCGDGVIDDGESCDDGNDDAGDGCAGCLLAPPPCSSVTVRDLAGGVPWSGAEILYQGTIGTENTGTLGCNSGVHPDAIHAVPVPAPGDLRVAVTGAPGLTVAVELRAQCRYQALACGVAPGPGETATVVRHGVRPEDGWIWIAVESTAGTGDYQLAVELVPPLPEGSPCYLDGRAGTCADTLTCADPDGDGAGRCGPLRAEGAACDPAGVLDACLESVCTCPVPGCTVGTCRSTCGDGTVQPWEECDDGDVAAADNCTASCESAGRSCAAPFRLELAPKDGGFEWTGSTAIGAQAFTPSCGPVSYYSAREVRGAFTAPTAGDWAFRVVPGDGYFDPILSVVTGACDSGVEFACSSGSDYDYATVRMPLAAGQTVWPVVDGGPTTSAGPFVLRAERVQCGNGIQELTEECDDGNLLDGDNCSPTCTVSGKSCADPFELSWDPVAREAVWPGDVGLGRNTFSASCVRPNYKDVVARFVAPAAGDFAFELLPAQVSMGLAVLEGPCETATEVGCSQWYVPGSTRSVIRTLAQGDVVWVRVDAYNQVPAGRGGFTLRVRPALCGDGIRLISEECDDGGTAYGDGCSSTCELEGIEYEPNNNGDIASPALVGGVLAASLDPGSEEDWFEFTAVQGATYTLALSAGQRGNCVIPPTGYFADLRLELFDVANTSLAVAPAIQWSCPRLTWTAPTSGSVYVQVRYGSSPRMVPRYFLEVTEQLP